MRIRYAVGYVLGVLLAYFLTGPVPPIPPVDRNGNPLRLKSLGMFRCPACGCMSNDSHRELCRGPVKTP